jgi:hypothetical protein
VVGVLEILIYPGGNHLSFLISAVYYPDYMDVGIAL